MDPMGLKSACGQALFFLDTWGDSVHWLFQLLETTSVPRFVAASFPSPVPMAHSLIITFLPPSCKDPVIISDHPHNPE